MKLPPYRVPHIHLYRTQVKQELDEMLEAGIIEPSNSNWSAPMIIVTRQDRPILLCVDYRRLNTVSKMDAYPTPRIDDLIDGLGKAKYISTIDLTRGYWQVPLSQELREKSAFAMDFLWFVLIQLMLCHSVFKEHLQRSNVSLTKFYKDVKNMLMHTLMM